MKRIVLAAVTAVAGMTGLVDRPAVAPAPTAATAAPPAAEPTPPARASRSSIRRHRPVARPAAHGVTPARRTGWRRWLDVTAYCATGNPTASGVMPAVGQAATYDRLIRFGTRLDVAGRRVVVTDRIGWGSDVDLYMGAGPACEQAAAAFGRRHLLVTEVTP